MTKCPFENKIRSLLLLLDVECFEVAKHLGLKLTTGFDEAMARVKNYSAITETSEEMRERLELRRQETGESIELFARDVKLIGHRAYSKVANSAMLEHILIKQFVNGLNNEVSVERVILKAPKTLNQAAQFSETAVRVARNYFMSTSTPSTVSSLGFRGRGSSSRPREFSSLGREQSVTRDNFYGRGRGRSSERGTFSTESRSSSNGPKFEQSQQQSTMAIKCFNCQKLGHYACDCRNLSGNGYGQGQGSSGNCRERPP